MSNLATNQQVLMAAMAEQLSPSRYEHTVRVVQQALRLAVLHGCDVDAAHVAAILHDCAKDLPAATQLKLAQAFGIVLADIERKNTALLHALVGAELAKREFHIENEEVLSAIRWHTTGRPDMTDLEKVIFLADYTEDGRQFTGIEQVREAALRNLDEAMLLALDQTIIYVVQRNWLLHPATVDARNFFILRRQSAESFVGEDGENAPS